ncbi:MAG: hypothetical protein JO352_07570 [Chloroflexi bacterium]|nr:hypothetical protein [Chloroflexota bacterium]MBV9602754.1 hypothetical protein [Chloroflexota bacterium]
MRRGLVRGVRYFVLHPVALIAVIALIVIVVVGVVAAPLYIGAIPGVTGLRSQTAPSATEDYLRGHRDFNADLVWNSLDADAQSRLTSQGDSRDDIQQQMDAAKQRGSQIAEMSYIGGKTLPDGTSMQFYLVGVRQQPGANVDYQPYMFTLDRDGKIAKVQ